LRSAYVAHRLEIPAALKQLIEPFLLDWIGGEALVLRAIAPDLVLELLLRLLRHRRLGSQHQLEVVGGNA
jgi:hypothetical protein